MSMKKSVTILVALCCCGGLFTVRGETTKKNDSAVPPWKRGVYADSVPAPTFSKVKYSERHRNILDFWKASSDQPTPLVISIHGGGWNGGAKEQVDSFVDVQKLLDAGISVAAINYRLIKHSKDETPFVKGPMTDAARAVQFLRSKAAEWNIDKTRLAAAGGSAGACTSLWLAYHDDLADPESDDPVARESTRLLCVAPIRPQTSLDPVQMKAWIPNIQYGAHAFGLESFDRFLAERDRILPWINEYSPYALLDAGDPPTAIFFPIAPTDDQAKRNPTHSPVFGVRLQERCRELGVPCELVYPGAPEVKHATATDYLIDMLKR